MALNIKNQDVEKLLNEVVRLTGESKTEAVRKALEERRQRLALGQTFNQSKLRLRNFLEGEVWPKIPPDEAGRQLSKEEEAILGFGAEGV